MLTDRLAKIYNGERGNETASVQMLISCAILPNNANGCSPAPVDIAWRYLEKTETDSTKINKGFLINLNY